MTHGLTPEETLQLGVERLGVFDLQSIHALQAYIAELERWSPKLGLVNASGRELVVRHILDSLAGLSTVQRLLGQSGDSLSCVADLGSGGGLPGIPLACFLHDTRFDLVERSGRKCGFLRNVVLTAQLHNVSVVGSDLSEVAVRYDLLVFRAFSQLSDSLVARLGALLAAGGAVCAYKGRGERVKAEIEALSASTRDRFLLELVPLSVPFLDEERNLLILTTAAGS